NTEAEVILPATDLMQVKENGADLSSVLGLQGLEQLEQNVRFQIGSGHYRFTFSG
ncbi:MAG: hypothetical protein H7X86_06820, partial [Gorillibacterium sp.]|nr:hypothetical protein [Gorillibacterium sp.]